MGASLQDRAEQLEQKMSSESFKRQERLRKRIGKEELNEKTFEEVKEEIFEWEEAAEIDPKKIEQIFNGEETEEESEPDKDKKFSKKTGSPIQIDSAEEVIELEDSGEEKSGRSRDRRDKRRYRKREPNSDHSDDPKKRKLDESSDRYENDSRDRKSKKKKTKKKRSLKKRKSLRRIKIRTAKQLSELFVKKRQNPEKTK